MKKLSTTQIWGILLISSLAIWIVIGATYVPWANITDVRHPLMIANAVYTIVTFLGWIGNVMDDIS